MGAHELCVFSLAGSSEAMFAEIGAAGGSHGQGEGVESRLESTSCWMQSLNFSISWLSVVLSSVSARQGKHRSHVSSIILLCRDSVFSACARPEGNERRPSCIVH